MAHVSVKVAAGSGRVLAPVGCPTPHLVPLGFDVEGATWRLTGDSATGQMVALIEPGGEITLRYAFGPGRCAYPEALFHPTDSRYTRAADALVDDAQAVARAAGGGIAGLHAVVQTVATLFSYSHPETKFYDEADHVPQLCGLTEGSCVDINLYLIASLRAAGYEAGYMTGYFFPEEKRGTCEDMHCWVVSRHAGEVLEWDIAHHMKIGRQPVQPGLNPKPGRRVPMAHSMGLYFPECGLDDLKLIAEPIRLTGQGWARCDLDIRLEDWAG